MAERTGGLDSELLAWAASRAAKWPHLLSSVIERYRRAHGLSDEQLCDMLGCDLDTLNRVRLCARPDPDSAAFAIDIQRIAGRFGVNVGVLTAIVREVDVVEALKQAGQVAAPFASSGMPEMLKAARDREQDDEGEGEDEGRGENEAGGEAGQEQGEESR
jgi:ribosomal protein L12E/L44/L45/RPP1/RPP2